MSKSFTIAQIEQLKSDGKIRGYNDPGKGSGPGLPKKKRGDKAKRWISKNIRLWCMEKKLVLKTEEMFHPLRKWRFDFSIKEIMVAVEYEGVFSEVSRHTTAKGYTGDIEKYNAAQALGWKVLRFTALNYKDLITELNKNICSDTKKQ